MRSTFKFIVIFLLFIGNNIAESNVTHNIKNKNVIVNPRLDMTYQLKNIKKEILNLKDNQIKKANRYSLKAAAICTYFEIYNKKLGPASKSFIRWKPSNGINNLKSLASHYL
jgi:hypothetical protein